MDPLFPATETSVGTAHQFEVTGLRREHWRTATPIRAIFKKAFAAAGLPYFNPHTLRNTLVALAQTRCKSPEEFKAWSQNLGHEGVLTTFVSYGAVQSSRQGEILGDLAKPVDSPSPAAEEIARALARHLGPMLKVG